jgi:hypothetical protein
MVRANCISCCTDNLLADIFAAAHVLAAATPQKGAVSTACTIDFSACMPHHF